MCGLDLGAQPAGDGVAGPSAAGLAPGLYVARLVTGAQTVETRVVVVR
jgi:hypothetical protein